MISLYNTLTKQLENLETNKNINLYSCGPTVYDVAHIGNLRSFIFADTVRRTLEYFGYKVNWVMNITDVDDKTIRKTITEKGENATTQDLLEVTDTYHQKFLKNLEALNIDTSTIIFIKVSEVIPQIIEFIQKLIDAGFAYRSDDGVYFNIAKYQEKFNDYGALVGEEFIAGKKIGARVNVDEYDKENLSDFALWKTQHKDDGQIGWDSAFGKGRPGWHIECSVINEVGFNGQATDIHTGGIDLVFPHHTNEIAQSQPIHNPFVKYWLHSEHLMVDGKKMAKRDNNFFTLEDLIQKYGPKAPMAFKYLSFQSHYRTSFNFTDESFKAALTALSRLHNLPAKDGESDFSELAQDFNTPKALAKVWEEGLTHSSKEFLTKALGLKLEEEVIQIPETVKELANQRQTAKANKDFTASDQLRDQIKALGYVIEDTPEGFKIKKS